ncbi:MAG: TOMM precursor leader peptide-binding protein [Geminicoccaceae bacterium]
MPRLAFKPHLQAHVLSDGEVALIGETERFALRGRAYALVAPLLDGTKDADEIAAALQGELAPEMTHFALGRLEERGYTTALPPEGLAAWSGWWLAHAEDHAARAETAAEVRVRITAFGFPAGLATGLAEKVGRSVRIVDADATLEACLVDDYLRPELGERITAAQEAGRVFLPIRPVGARIWLGPLCRPDDPPDWPAFVARLRSNRPADAAVLAQGRSFPVMPTVSTPETAALGLSLAAVTIVRCAAGEVPAAIDRAIWTFDPHTLEARSHPLPPPAMASSSGAADAARPIELVASPKHYRADGGHRVCPPEETLDRLNRFVSPITGIVPGIEKSRCAAGIHVYGALQTMGMPLGSPRHNRFLGRPDGAAGKGQTDIQARVSCLAEAIERYSCGFFGDGPRRLARLDELGPAAIHPQDILLFSVRQYQGREANNKVRGAGVNWIPEPFDPARQVEWTPVWSLTERRTRWVPTALCYFGCDPSRMEGVPRFASADSNGCASGNTLEEAILQGLFELIERDACALWWYNRVRRPAIDLASFRQPFFEAMQNHYRDRGRVLRVLDLRTDLDIPVAMAVSWREEDCGKIHLGLGCHLEARLAVSRALSELNQMAAVEGADDPAPDDPDLVRWLHAATIENQPYVVPLEDQVADANDFEDQSSDDITADVRLCVERLRELGHEALILDHTRPDIGFPTARVIVPGLRHFWARFAPGRLYDVPVSLRWLEQAHREEDLNPIPLWW